MGTKPKLTLRCHLIELNQILFDEVISAFVLLIQDEEIIQRIHELSLLRESSEKQIDNLFLYQLDLLLSQQSKEHDNHLVRTGLLRNFLTH
jgi:hypothetical protein